MHPALITYLEEYQIWLNATRKSTEDTRDKFIEIQNKVRENGYTEQISKELFGAYHFLFQTNYLLMESHLRVKNLYANYSENDKKIIDEYDQVDKKANKLIANMMSYKETLENRTETSNNI